MKQLTATSRSATPTRRARASERPDLSDCPHYLAVAVSAPALRLLAPRDIALLLALAAGPQVIETTGETVQGAA